MPNYTADFGGRPDDPSGTLSIHAADLSDACRQARSYVLAGPANRTWMDLSLAYGVVYCVWNDQGSVEIELKRFAA